MLHDKRIFELNAGCSFACYIQGDGLLLSSAALCIVFSKESAQVCNVIVEIKRD